MEDESKQSINESLLISRMSISLTRPSNFIPSGLRQKYYKELLNEIEIFMEGDNFVIASKFSSQEDLLNLQSFNLSKNPGIYVIFNGYYYYVGQSSKEIILRLLSHYKDGDKSAVLPKGRVVFFGRTDGKLSKDQLDYIEKSLIGRFDNHNRKKLNRNSGNTSYISEGQRIIADYLIQTFYRIVSVSSYNPYVEDAVITVNRISGIIDTFTNLDEPIDSRSLEEIQQSTNNLLKNFNFNPVLIEYQWPNSFSAVTQPIEKPNSMNPFYLVDRDGYWPELQKTKDFQSMLLTNYLERRDKLNLN